MSDNVVPAWVYTHYMDGVVQKLQTRGSLLQGTNLPGEANGNEVQWFTGGRMETEEIDRSNDEAALQHPDRSKITANFKDYAAAATVSIVDINKVKPNELAQLQLEGAAAIGRRSDWIQLDEMWRAAEASEVETIGDGSADIDILDVMQGRDDIAGIGDLSIGATLCAMPEYAFSRLCLIKEFANSDWVGPDMPLTKLTSSRKTWRNVNFFTLPDEYFTRYGTQVKTSGNFYGWLWWSGSIGFLRKDPPVDVKISYLPTKRKWFVDNVIGGTSKILQPDAMKRLFFNWSKPARPS